MKQTNNITVPGPQLRDAIVVLKAFHHTRNTLPILGNCLIRAVDPHTVRFTLDNLNQRVDVDVHTETPSEGGMAVPIVFLSKMAIADSVTFEVQGADVLIRAGMQTHKLPHWHGWEEDYPPAAKWTSLVHIVCDTSERSERLRTSFLRAMSVSSTDQTRYVLNGVYFDLENGNLVATDGRRAAIFTCLPTLKPPMSFIWPNFKLGPLARAEWERISANPAECMAKLRGKTMGGNAFQVTTKLIEGNYPNYLQVIPDVTDAASVFVSDPIELAKLLRTLPDPVDRKSDSVVIEARAIDLEIGNQQTQFYWPAIGEVENVPRVAYNRDYLAAALDWGWGWLRLLDGISPGVVAPDLSSGDKYIVMPMRVME